MHESRTPLIVFPCSSSDAISRLEKLFIKFCTFLTLTSSICGEQLCSFNHLRPPTPPNTAVLTLQTYRMYRRIILTTASHSHRTSSFVLPHFHARYQSGEQSTHPSLKRQSIYRRTALRRLALPRRRERVRTPSVSARHAHVCPHLSRGKGKPALEDCSGFRLIAFLVPEQMGILFTARPWSQLFSISMK